jgi:hypothetical protein
MTALDKPIYLLALRDGWVCVDIGPEICAAIAFGTRDEAQQYLEHHAEVEGVPPSLMRVVEFTFSGNVSEG